MVARRRKKKSRQRGSWTHGWGAKKKHRGSGHRGGVGMAGSGKRADSKKPSVWKIKNYFGKYGFKKKGIKIKINAINIEEVDKLVSSGKIKKEEIINLGALGYNKLLGKGLLRNQLKIRVNRATKKALAKVKEKGGEIITQKEESR